MTKINRKRSPAQYTAKVIDRIGKMVKDCRSVSEAYDFLEKQLDLSRDHISRLNRKYGFYTGGLVDSFGDVNQSLASRSIKRLYLDIEVSPDVCLSWRTGYKINLDPNSIIKERSIICIGFMWEGEKEAHIINWDDDQNDKEMLMEIMNIVNEADEIVMHNGDKFDLPWIKTRCLYHNLPAFPDHKTVDTLKIARRKFYFNSNKLDYIAQYLGIGRKIKTEFGLWRDILLKNCRTSLHKMGVYCKQDVLLLQQVYNKLRLSASPKTHAGVLAGKPKFSCPHCGSIDVKMTKKRVTAAGTIQYQFQCKKCGAYFTVSESVYQDYLGQKN